MRVFIIYTAVLIVVVTALGIAHYVDAFGVDRLPAPSERFRCSLGTAASYGSREYRVDIQKIIPYMREARWTSGHWFWKIPQQVALDDGERFEIDGLAYFFQIKGVPGIFFVDGPRKSEYEALCSQIFLK